VTGNELTALAIDNQQLTSDNFLAVLRYDAAGLIPAIVQDAATGQVLMLAWMNAESLRHTLQLGETVFWSRSRQEFWHKGATSGNVQRVVDMRVDCDGDTLLVLVDPAGPACHTGAISCFYRSAEKSSYVND
jgi:phosphoribosyl-AMP cyclohydrolase